jgi:hypothetical protein
MPLILRSEGAEAFIDDRAWQMSLATSEGSVELGKRGFRGIG